MTLAPLGEPLCGHCLELPLVRRGLARSMECPKREPTPPVEGLAAALHAHAYRVCLPHPTSATDGS